MASAIQAVQRDKMATMEVRADQLASYNKDVQSSLQRTVWNSGCASYFIDRNGRNSTNWPWTTFTMRRRLARFVVQDFVTETRKP